MSNIAVVRRDRTARWYTTLPPAPEAPLLSEVAGGIAVNALPQPAIFELVTDGCDGTGERVMRLSGEDPGGASAGIMATEEVGGLIGREFGEEASADGARFSDLFNEDAWETETCAAAEAFRSTI